MERKSYRVLYALVLLGIGYFLGLVSLPPDANSGSCINVHPDSDRAAFIHCYGSYYVAANPDRNLDIKSCRVETVSDGKHICTVTVN